VTKDEASKLQKGQRAVRKQGKQSQEYVVVSQSENMLLLKRVGGIISSSWFKTDLAEFSEATERGE
jgi:hypothetical protein